MHSKILMLIIGWKSMQTIDAILFSCFEVKANIPKKSSTKLTKEV
jgi:hypothetical protein